MGWENIAKAAEGKFLIFGEMHGTNEVPAAFGGYVCEVVQQEGTTVVWLEMSQSYQAALVAAKLREDPRSFLVSEMKDQWSIEDVSNVTRSILFSMQAATNDKSGVDQMNRTTNGITLDHFETNSQRWNLVR